MEAELQGGGSGPAEARASAVTRRVAVALVLAALAGCALMHYLVGRRFAAQVEDRAQRSAMIVARAAAAIGSAHNGEGDALRAAMTDWARSHRVVKAVRVINTDNRSFEFSTFAADRKEGDLPRRMVRSEKPLYDLGETLRANVETNQQEHAARKEEVTVELLADGTMLIAAPVESNGAVVGFAQAQVVPARVIVQPPPWWVALAFALAPLVVFVGASPLMRNMGSGALVLVAAVLLLGFLFAYRQYATASLVSGTRAAEQKFAQQRTLEQDLVARVAPGAQADAASWDSDVYRRAVHLDPAREIAAQTSAVAQAGYGIALVSLAILLFFGFGTAGRMRAGFVRNRQAYAYIAPAMVGMVLLVFFPFIYSITLSFTSQNIYSINKPLTDIWVGVQNYVEILGDTSVVKSTAAGRSANYENFYWTLFFTVAWTVVNVTIGVTVGLVLALMLNTKGLRAKAAYRVLLILPWAVPNYITALIWKGMFHQQFGVINQIIQIFGGAPVSWFERPFTSFVAVVTTNGWLSFPFMMVVSLGALQSIPADLYEAARVDGASRWQQFTAITLPSLKPALVPAVILSVVWTFNMFNIIYLVSAGEPAKSTEILITQAYKIAFEQYRYGYAAAYSTVIFAILLIYGVFQNRVTRGTEAIA